MNCMQNHEEGPVRPEPGSVFDVRTVVDEYLESAESPSNNSLQERLALQRITAAAALIKGLLEADEDDHPRPEELVWFDRGELAGLDEAYVKVHLESCILCQSQL